MDFFYFVQEFKDFFALASGHWLRNDSVLVTMVTSVMTIPLLTLMLVVANLANTK